MANRIQIRRDTQANWERINPVLADGEPGLNYDTNQVKYGDGESDWMTLDYAGGGSSSPGDFLDYGLIDTGSGNVSINLSYTYHWIVNLSGNPGANRRYYLANGSTNGQTIYFVPSNPFEPTNTQLLVNYMAYYATGSGYLSESLVLQLFSTTNNAVDTIVRATWLNDKWLFTGPVVLA
jgi:hypothetical protein